MAETDDREATRGNAEAAHAMGGAVDVSLLADRVYQLMVDEIRLERKRLGGTLPHSRG